MTLIDDLKNNKGFMELSVVDRQKALAKLNQGFAELKPLEQRKALNKLGLGSPKLEMVSKMAHEIIPPVASALAGAAGFAAPVLTVAGAPSAPLTAAAAGTAAYVGTEQLLKRADEFVGLKEPVTPTMTGIGAEVLSDTTAGMFQETMGPLASKAVGATKAVGKGIVTAAEKIGAKMTAAQITKAKPLAWIEAVGEKFLPSMPLFKSRRATQLQALENETDEILETLGSNESREAITDMVKGGIQALNFKRQNFRNKIYDRTKDMVPKETQIGFDTFSEKSDELLIADQQVPQYFQQMKGELLESLAKIRQQGLTWDGALTLRKKINAMIGPIADTAEKIEILKPLRKALDQDIAIFADATGGPLLKTFKLANSYHGAIKDLMQHPVVQSVIKSAPDKVARTLLERNSPDTWTVLRKALPEKNFRLVQKAVVDELFSTARLRPQDIKVDFPLGKLPEVLSQNMRRYRMDTLEAALPKGSLQKLQEFADIARAVLPSADVLAGNASGSASSMLGGGGAFALMNYTFHNPVAGTSIALGAPALAWLYLTPGGTKLVTQGLKTLTPHSAVSKQVLTAAERLAAVKTYKALENAAREQKLLDTPGTTQPPQTRTPAAEASPYRPAEPMSRAEPSPADGAYREAFAEFMRGNRDKALVLAKKAQAVDPSNKYVQTMLRRLEGE